MSHQISVEFRYQLILILFKIDKKFENLPNFKQMFKKFSYQFEKNTRFLIKFDKKIHFYSDKLTDFNDKRNLNEKKIR